MSRIDISFTVREKERNGRTLWRDINTGQIYWEPAEAPAVAEADTPAEPVPTPTKKRRRRSSEGDK